MKQKLLLHACCGPCSSAILEEYHKHFDITLYYYNPCITNEDEYNKRADELISLVHDKMDLDINIVCEYFNPDSFHAWADELSDEPEGGKRCALCYRQRLINTAKYAKDHGFEYFSTTLTISPYKDSAMINSIGRQCGCENNVMYMPFDFGYLYPRSLELCEKYHLYQQDYCGCEFSKKCGL